MMTIQVTHYLERDDVVHLFTFEECVGAHDAEWPPATRLAADERLAEAARHWGMSYRIADSFRGRTDYAEAKAKAEALVDKFFPELRGGE